MASHVGNRSGLLRNAVPLPRDWIRGQELSIRFLDAGFHDGRLQLQWSRRKGQKLHHRNAKTKWTLTVLTNLCASPLIQMLASYPYRWSSAELVLISLSRILLVPLMVLCAAPRYAPLIPGEFSAFVLSALLGVTNGVFGSVPMILAPSKVNEAQKEMAGKRKKPKNPNIIFWLWVEPKTILLFPQAISWRCHTVLDWQLVPQWPTDWTAS